MDDVTGGREGDGEGLRFAAVVLHRGERAVLDGVDLHVPRGRVTCLRGPSGAGKSTLLRVAVRLDLPDAGRVLVDGTDTAGLPPGRLRRRVAMVWQRPVMLGPTVLDDLRLADPQLAREDARALLDGCGLGGTLDAAVGTLSGGEAQRACLVRSLLTGPDVVLADEPTASLDPESASLVEAMLRERAAAGSAVLWVTHDVAQAARVADRVAVLAEGRVRLEEPAG